MERSKGAPPPFLTGAKKKQEHALLFFRSLSSSFSFLLSLCHGPIPSNRTRRRQAASASIKARRSRTWRAGFFSSKKTKKRSERTKRAKRASDDKRLPTAKIESEFRLAPSACPLFHFCSALVSSLAPDLSRLSSSLSPLYPFFGIYYILAPASALQSHP